MYFLALPLVIATGALLVITTEVILSIATLFLNSRIDTFATMNLILGKTKDPLALKNKSGMMINSKGKVNYQSVRA